MKKVLANFILTSVFILALRFYSSAETFSLYSSLDDSSNQAKVLADLMVNDQDYDPFDQYVIFRAGDNDYRCYFGKSISGNVVGYRYQQANYGQPATITRLKSSNINITSNGYIYCGNVSGSARMATAATHNFQFLVPILLIMVIIILIFRTFRKKFNMKVGSYNV